MSQAPNDLLFSMLPERRAPWKEFVFSIGGESLLVLALVWVGVLHPEIIVPLGSMTAGDCAGSDRLIPVNHQPAPLKVIKPAFVPPPKSATPPVQALRRRYACLPK